MLKILQGEVILLNEAVTCVNSADKEAIAGLSHRLKGICCYLVIQIETIFCYPDSKFELMLIVQVLQNQIVVVLDEV
ncbi:hypothetical protein Swoo_2331 [Shewanella woodyi ATCC 51908]|uniref:HPt domain-containing protein n=1 Tax=Shewanella woodyi (strain ATCC 51908 / MS32) TaxID=392500 RepID=B1KF69_SHEWM|nr:hypothetical protein Swoo_2331 [Shewanella woodyi ATCC 51908]